MATIKHDDSSKSEVSLPESELNAPSQPEGDKDIPVFYAQNIRERNGWEESLKEEESPTEEPSSVELDPSPLMDFDPLAPYKSMVTRYLQINRHTIGLFAGGLIAFRKALPKHRTRGVRFLFTRIASFLIKPFVLKEIRNKPFPVQLRRRLEMLGPTYIKFGQILALREDILPKVVTKELTNLLDRLPEIPFEVIKDIIENDLGVLIEDAFSSINEKPIGSASIAQTHLATTKEGEKVVLKVVKPGIRDSILTDIRLLKLLAKFLQWAIPQYQPTQLIDEFCDYTEKEVFLTSEADHAELFAANFADMENVVFPKIYRHLSGDDVLCMEFFDGFKPGAPPTKLLNELEREILVEAGSEAIIRMLYKDGFFHADLHPGNLMVLDGPKVGFIDLGMVGRFEDKTRRRMLYYFHALVKGDIEGATKYLLALARVGEGGNPQGFRRSVSDQLRRYYMHAGSGEYSMAQLILQSLSIGGQYKVFFPVEMTLMVKALVTFEGVGMMLKPDLNVPEVSEKYVAKIFKEQFNPVQLSKQMMRGTPELLDMIVQLPKLTADTLKYLEEALNDRSPNNPLAGLRSSIIAGACIVGGVLALIQGAHWGVYLSLFGLGFLLTVFGK